MNSIINITNICRERTQVSFSVETINCQSEDFICPDTGYNILVDMFPGIQTFGSNMAYLNRDCISQNKVSIEIFNTILLAIYNFNKSHEKAS